MPIDVWRLATPSDAGPLRDLERSANLAALSHVFPPERFPFPDDDVLARWALVLADREVTTEVVDIDGEQGLIAFAAYDAWSLRHLAVHPDHWGHGLAKAGVERALSAIKAGGATEARLWCLEDNDRAQELYRRLGWGTTGTTRPAPWPPHPMECELAVSLARPRP